MPWLHFFPSSCASHRSRSMVDMLDNEPRKKESHVLVSAVADDGTLIETICNSGTSFVVQKTGDVRTESALELRGKRFRPVSADNNLLRHGAVLLPSEAVAYAGEAELAEEIASYVRRYVTLSDSAAHIAVSYIFLTWIYDTFNELPYLRFRGDYGTGKTRALTIIGSVCYKAFFASGASTVSPIFHTLDLFGGTLVFDEADFRFTDERAEIIKIFNNGNARGFPVLRTQVTRKKEFDPRAFTVFGPKIVAMRRAFDDRALESRFLTVEMEPQKRGAPLNLPDGQKAEALALRNKLLMYRFRNRLNVALDAALADPVLEPRLNQIVLPLLSIAKDADARAAILTYVRGLQSNIMSYRSTSSEGQVLAVLSEMRHSDSSAVADVCEAFKAKYAADYERPVTNRWIASLLRRLGLVLYKSNGVTVIADGQEERLAALFARYGVENEADAKKLGS